MGTNTKMSWPIVGQGSFRQNLALTLPSWSNAPILPPWMGEANVTCVLLKYHKRWREQGSWRQSHLLKLVGLEAAELRFKWQSWHTGHIAHCLCNREYCPCNYPLSGCPVYHAELELLGNSLGNCRMRTGETAQWVKVLAAKPDAWSLIPEVHMVEGKLTPTNCSLTSTSSLCVCVNTHTRKLNLQINVKAF